MDRKRRTFKLSDLDRNFLGKGNHGKSGAFFRSWRMGVFVDRNF